MTPRKVKRPPAQPVVVPVEERPAILGEHFTEGTWKGLPNLVCHHCSAGFLDPDRAVEHYVYSHLPAVPEQRTRLVDTGLVAPSGAAIVREEPALADDLDQPEMEADA